MRDLNQMVTTVMTELPADKRDAFVDELLSRMEAHLKAYTDKVPEEEAAQLKMSDTHGKRYEDFT